MRSLLLYNRLKPPKTLLAFLRKTLTIRHFRIYIAVLSNLLKRNIICRINKTNRKRLELLNYYPE